MANREKYHWLVELHKRLFEACEATDPLLVHVSRQIIAEEGRHGAAVRMTPQALAAVQSEIKKTLAGLRHSGLLK